MQNEKICHQGHVLDEGKQNCSRCNEPAESEIKDNEIVPINQESASPETSTEEVNVPVEEVDAQPEEVIVDESSVPALEVGSDSLLKRKNKKKK